MINLEDMHPDVIFSVSWSRNGSLLCTACKDKKVRVIDPRKKKIVTVSRNPLWFSALHCSAMVTNNTSVSVLGEGQSPRGCPTNESDLLSRRKYFHHRLQPHEWAPTSLVEKCTSMKWLLNTDIVHPQQTASHHFTLLCDCWVNVGSLLAMNESNNQ